MKRLIDGGATLIQLREKYLPPIEFLREAEAALKVADHAGVGLIINDRVDIAMSIGAAGVHLGQTDLPAQAVRRLMKENTIIGFSSHTPQQVEAAVRLPISYVAFGPVFTTRTKQDHEPTVGLQQLCAVKEIAAELPLVAIGGIHPESIRAVLDAGANAIAVISAAVGEPAKIARNMRRMLELAGD